MCARALNSDEMSTSSAGHSLYCPAVAGLDPIPWTVSLRCLSLRRSAFLSENDEGCGRCGNLAVLCEISKSLVGAFFAFTGTTASMPYAAARRSKAAGLICPSVEWRRRWL